MTIVTRPAIATYPRCGAYVHPLFSIAFFLLKFLNVVTASAPCETDGCNAGSLSGSSCGDGSCCSHGGMCSSGVCGSSSYKCLATVDTCETDGCHAGSVSGSNCQDGDCCSAGTMCSEGVCDPVSHKCKNGYGARWYINAMGEWQFGVRQFGSSSQCFDASGVACQFRCPPGLFSATGFYPCRQAPMGYKTTSEGSTS